MCRAGAGVPQYWPLDPEAIALDVLDFDGDTYRIARVLGRRTSGTARTRQGSGSTWRTSSGTGRLRADATTIMRHCHRFMVASAPRPLSRPPRPRPSVRVDCI